MRNPPGHLTNMEKLTWQPHNKEDSFFLLGLVPGIRIC